MDNLKIAIRPFHVRYTSERLLDFDEELSNVVRKKQILDEEIEDIKRIKSENEEILAKLAERQNELSGLLEKLTKELEDTETKNGNVLNALSVLESKITDGQELIIEASGIVTFTEEKLDEAKKSTETIQKFEETIEKRLKQVDTIDLRTQEYRNNIEAYEVERIELNKKAKDTINDALNALEYNTARGLSASFQAQLTKIEESHYNRWLVGSGVFLALTLCIGIWIVLAGHNDISATIGRVILTSFTITGSIFCANQYIRQKNVIEDYTYKMVLAKSIVGFSQQLNNGAENSAEYKNYIQLALSEIHQDPLRKRSKMDKDVDGGIKSGIDMVIETAQKIVGLTKNN